MSFQYLKPDSLAAIVREEFLDDLIALYRKHQLCLGHEDAHGSFLIEPLAEWNIKWVSDAPIQEEVGGPFLYPLSKDQGR
jgi:hypothetical protein